MGTFLKCVETLYMVFPFDRDNIPYYNIRSTYLNKNNTFSRDLISTGKVNCFVCIQTFSMNEWGNNEVRSAPIFCC